MILVVQYRTKSTRVLC